MSAPLSLVAPLTPDQREVLRRLLRGPLCAPELAAAPLSDLRVRAVLVVLSARELVRPAGGAWEVVDQDVVVELLNADASATGVRVAIEKKAELGRSVVEGC